MAKKAKRPVKPHPYHHSWAFIAGVVIAVVVGLFSTAVAPFNSALLTLLIVLGLVVGFFNVSKKETNNYLLATVSIVIVSAVAGVNFGAIAYVGEFLTNLFNAILAFIVPAVIIVGLKRVYFLSRS